jgi:hypothetical protein
VTAAGSNRDIDTAIQRSSHDSVLLELMRSICPACRRVLEAEVLARGGKVYLRKLCPDHSEFEALVYGDAERYVEIRRFNKPGERPLRLQTEVVDGCPRDYGICPEHKQHTCLGIIEVNQSPARALRRTAFRSGSSRSNGCSTHSSRRRASPRRSSSRGASRPSTPRSSTCLRRPRPVASSW